MNPVCSIWDSSQVSRAVGRFSAIISIRFALSSFGWKNIPLSSSGKSSLQARAILSRRGALAIVTNVGTGCGGRGSVERERNCRAGFPVSDLRMRRRTRLKRTAKPCGPGTRCWCQADGGSNSPTGRCEPLIRERRWQDEFVAGESTV